MAAYSKACNKLKTHTESNITHILKSLQWRKTCEWSSYLSAQPDLCSAPSCYSLLICCHPFSTTYIFFSKNHQSLISLCISSSLESTSCLIPSALHKSFSWRCHTFQFIFQAYSLINTSTSSSLEWDYHQTGRHSADKPLIQYAAAVHQKHSLRQFSTVLPWPLTRISAGKSVTSQSMQLFYRLPHRTEIDRIIPGQLRRSKR